MKKRIKLTAPFSFIHKKFSSLFVNKLAKLPAKKIDLSINSDSTSEVEIHRLVHELDIRNRELGKLTEELKSSREQLSFLVHEMQVGVLLQGPKAEILMSNKKALELLGLSEDQLMGRSSFSPEWNVIHEDGLPFPGDTHPVPQAIAKKCPVMDVVMGVYRPVTEDRVWLLVSAVPQLSGDGMVKQVVCTFIDISERKLAEEALIKSSKRFEALLSQAPFNGVIYKLIRDDAGLIIDWEISAINELGAASLGLNRASAIGKRVLALFGANLMAPYFEIIQQVLSNSKAQTFETYLEANGHSYLTSVFMVDSDHYANMGIDITSRKYAEQALRESEEQYRSLFENMINGFAYCQMLFEDGKPNDFIYLKVNAAFESLTGLRNITGKKVSVIIPGIRESDSNLIETYGRVALTGIPETFETFVESLNDWYFISVYSPKSGFFIAIFDVITERKLAQKALIESEHLLRKSQAVARIGSFVWDLSTGNWKSSEILDEIFGIGVNFERTLDGWTSIVHPDWQTKMTDYVINEILEKKQNFDMEYQIIRQDNGEERWVHGIGAIEFNTDNLAVRLIGTISDITDYVEVKEKVNHLAAIVQSSDDAIIGKDLNSSITSWNKGAEKLFGYSEDEMIGHSIMQLIPEDLRNEESQILDNIKLGNRIQNFETVRLTKSGNLLDVSVTVSPILNSLGKVVGASKVVRNITERKTAEKLLRESHEFSTSLLKTIPFGMDIVDETGTIKYQSEKFSTFFSEKVVGKKCWEVYRDDKTQCADCPLINGITIDETQTCESQDVLGGKTFEIIHTGIIYDGKKAMLEVFQDITGRMVYENNLMISKDKAEESDRLKSAFLANMSHEIRTPMNGILGFAELLKQPKLSGEEQHEYVELIEKSGIRMLNIINDIIDISKIESGLMKVEMKESNINEQIDYLFTFFKPECDSKGIHLVMKNSLPSNQSIIKTDREKVFAILTNLIKNAIKYSKNGTIEFGYNLVTKQSVVTENAASLLEFFVTDQGIGIPAHRHDAVFERFIQADIADRNAYQGAGLGLAIAKSYVEMLGGKIRLESEEGKGSSFYFTLPYNIVFNNKEILEETASAIADKDTVRKLKVLIVEDDAPSSRLISIFLKKVSDSILFAKTGVEAIEKCRNNPDIDLVLMDIQLPEMNGYVATSKIRDFNKKVVIIAQTAFGLLGDREKALEAGCDDYISKPIAFDSLKKMIEKHFN